MNLWIRNQDKDILVKINNIFLEKRKNMILTAEDFEENKDSYRIISYIKNNKYFDLGTYKTKERALEVLDDIQRYLIPSIDMIGKIPEDGKIYGVNSIVSMVYQMPED